MLTFKSLEPDVVIEGSHAGGAPHTMHDPYKLSFFSTPKGGHVRAYVLRAHTS